MKLIKLFTILLSLVLVSSCASIGVMISSVTTSPKLLMYATHKSYDKNIEVDVLIDEKPYKINLTVKCLKQGVRSPGANTMSWTEEWKEDLKNNEIVANKDTYRVILGDLDLRGKVYRNWDRTFYGYSRRSWCGDLLRDSKSIKEINDDNSIVLISDDNDRKTLSKYHNPSANFLYVIEEKYGTVNNPNQSTWDKIAKNAVIKGFKVR